MKTLNEKFGQPSELAIKKIQPFMNQMVQDFIQEAPFSVLATADANGLCDASPRGGTPGFFKVLDEKRILLPDIAGNRLFQSFSNVLSNAHAGLIFLIPGCDWTVRVNGRAQIVSPETDGFDCGIPATFWEDDETRILQALLIEVDEAYAHCPRAFLFSKLWDTGSISENIEQNANQIWFKRWRESFT
ncbi:MAG: pyridoxamine 5'-phosphate oxidase family protein [Myxococcota bacterium]|nr:pyridoxamine 5'-phosphate oxidase family protein [Myxococcota bacterium]